MYVKPCHLLNIVTVSWITAVTSQIPSPIAPDRRLHVTIPRDDVQGTPVVSLQRADTPVIIYRHRWNSSVLEVLLKKGHIRGTGRHVTLREEMTTPCHATVYVSAFGRHKEGSNTAWSVRKVSTGKSILTKLDIHFNDTLNTCDSPCDIAGNDSHFSLTCINTTCINIVKWTRVGLMCINTSLENIGLLRIFSNRNISLSCPDTTVLKENSRVAVCCISFKLATNNLTSMKMFFRNDGCCQVNLSEHIKTLPNTGDKRHRQRLRRKGKRKRRGLVGGHVTSELEEDFHIFTDHVTEKSVVIKEEKVKAASRTKHADLNNSSHQNPETSRTAMTASLALLGVALVMITVALSIIFKPEEEEEEPEKKDEATEKLLIEGGE